MVTDSFEYAKEALVGKWARWIILIILGLPLALTKFVFDPEKIMNKATGAIHWEMIHWDQLAALIILGIIFEFIISGYLVRIYRGANPAPEIENWIGLFIDGVKISIVWFLWFLPFFIVGFAAIVMILVTAIGAGTGNSGSILAFLALAIILLIVASVLLIITGLYGYLGVIRFARTGSIREGVHFSKITEMIRNLGWLTYFIALLVVFVVGIAFGIVTVILSLIPYIGWLLVVIISPFIAILFARYATLVYEQAQSQPVAAVQQYFFFS